MKDIERVVQGILSQVKKAPASKKPKHNTQLLEDETLAAFIAKAIILERAEKDFLLDKGITEEKLNELIELSVDRLLECDSPSLETLKLQVHFDSAYIRNERRLEKETSVRKQHMAAVIKGVVSSNTGDNFEAINAIYRAIFNFLVIDSHHNTTISIVDEGKDAAVSRLEEREIAAALESVYPKIGIKMFVNYSESEKRNQLAELANIVMGIRVFNQAIGQSSTKAADLVSKSQRTAMQLLDSLDLEVEDITGICESYSEILAYTLSCETAIAPRILNRWKDELTNRRQYLSYLTSLLEDVEQSHDIIMETTASLSTLVDETQKLVGSKATIPKQQVYPKFDGLAVAWKKLLAEYQVILARKETLDATRCHRDTFSPKLDLDLLRKSRLNKKLANSSTKSSGPNDDLIETQQAVMDLVNSLNNELPNNNSSVDERKTGDEESKQDTESKHPEDSNDTNNDTSPAVTLLSLEDTPDFMHLPLEYQGFCPWTITMRKGLLLPGKPDLGVVEYNNTFNVFVDEVAQREFMSNPQFFAKGVIRQAKMSPELIHLLHLQNAFPSAALSHLLLANSSPDSGGSNGPSDAPVVLVDAATETPVHFVEKHIDYSYEYSEWALRRKALQLANLRKMKTVSSQTERSHFRRENNSQVYLPREQGSQTGVNKGTNPSRKLRYVSGLRANQPSKFVDGKSVDESKIAVVEYTYEL